MARYYNSANPRERLTGSRPTITTDHEYIHDGKAFRFEGKTASINAGARAYIAFKTPSVADGRYVHFRPESWFSTANAIEITVWEGENIVDGAAYTPINQNRNKRLTNVSKMTCRTAPTIAPSIRRVGGPYPGGVGGNAQNRAGGALSGQDAEIVYLPDTWYVIQFENIGTITATVVYYNLYWYEEDQG